MAFYTPMETVDAKDRYFHKRIESITERDFWSSMRWNRELAPAIAAGRAGRRDEAYRLLGAYHAKTLYADADTFRTQVKARLSDPDALARSRDAAQRVLEHDIPLWHETRIQFGPRIDFKPDVTTSVMYGYHYMGWLSPVVDQYAITGEAAFRDGLADIVQQYYDQRTTIPWVQPAWSPVYYELGARAKAGIILPAYAMLCNDPALTADNREAMLKLLLGFARSLYRMQTDEDYRPGNWQIGGCLALFNIGTALADFRDAKRWCDRAQELLMEHARRDFFPDGGHAERTWAYGIISLKGLQGFYQTALRRGDMSPARKRFWTEFCKRGYAWFAKTLAPGQVMLNYGDGVLGPATGVIQGARQLDPQWADKPDLFGVDRSRSYLLEPSGFAIMRAGGSPDDMFMSVNFGPHGGVHTHADLLDFTLWAHGEPLIEEVGRFGDYDIPLNPLFKSDAAHNQIVIEHQPMRREGAVGHDVAWLSDPTADLFSAWHEAYPGHRIQRMIAFVNDGYVVVYDAITTAQTMRQVSHLLHACRPFEVLSDGRARVKGSPSCLVQFARPAELREFSTRPDYLPEHYGARDDDSPHLERYPYSLERHRLTSRKWHDTGRRTPITFACLLLPFKGKGVPEASITPVRLRGDASGQAGGFTVTVDGRRNTIVFNPARAALDAGNIQTSSLIALWRRRTRVDLA